MGMVRSAQQRSAMFDAKWNDEAYVAICAAVEAVAKAGYEGFANVWVAKRDETLGVLAAAGVSRLVVGSYLAYSAELYKLTLWASGELAAVAADEIETKWTSRGLAAAVLADIKYDVWSIADPIPPA